MAEEGNEMKCLNTKGCYDKEAVSGSKFCSPRCRAIYQGRAEPPIKDWQKYDDPDRQSTHDIYMKGYGNVETIPDYEEPTNGYIKEYIYENIRKRLEEPEDEL